MDSAYYYRLADQERRRHEQHQHAIAQADGTIAKEESAADRDSRDALSARSESTARSKRSSEQRHRTAASKAREARAKASAAASKSQAAINKLEQQARAADETARKKQADKQRQDDRAAQRARDAEQRAREAERRSSERTARQLAAESMAQTREVTELRARTDDLEEQLRRARLAAPKQICVLFIAGTIEGGDEPLHLDREIREIQQRVAASTHRDKLRIEFLHATQVRDIIDGLNRVRPDVVHFSGHGHRSVLLFEGADGRPHELRDEQLALLLQAAPNAIRLLVLNACESATMAVLATDYLEAAIGMETPINDGTAKEFAGQLYASLAEGLSLAVAFNQAKVQANIIEDATGRPRLSTAEGLDAEEIVLVSP